MTDDEVVDPSARAVRRVPRLPIIAVLVVIGVLVAAIGSADAPEVSSVEDPTDPVALAPDDVLSVAWYCGGAPLALRDAADGTVELATTDERILVANIGDEPQPVRLLAFADGEVVAGERREVPPGSVREIVVAELTDAAEPGVVVEAFSNEVVVEYEVVSEGLAVGPCSTEPASEWYFPAGSTAAGSQQWLSLFNPFGDDAVVDVVFDGEDGRRAPEALAGLTVPRRSRITIPVHDEVLRDDLVATTVIAQMGRIVATQAVDIDEGVSGTAMGLGAVAPATRWVFSGGLAAEGVDHLVAVMNPGDVDTEVDVRVVTSDGSLVEPIVVSLPRRGAVQVNVSEEFGDALTADTAYALVVESGTGGGVIVADRVTWDGVVIEEETFSGVASALGASRAARRWVFAASRVRDADVVVIAVMNPGTEAVTVDVMIVSDGETREPTDATAVPLPAGGLVRLAIPTPTADGAVVVEATGPVTAQRIVTHPDLGVSVDAGIPPASAAEVVGSATPP